MPQIEIRPAKSEDIQALISLEHSYVSDYVWQMEIEPYLEEYFFDQPDKTEAYRWEKISKDIIK